MAKIKPSPELFPILNQPTGIARLAAEAEHTGDGHLIEFRALKVRSLLNKTVSKRSLRFSWSINPYRGCEFGCRYCYARYTHEFMELRDPEQFERLIFLKQNAAWLLEQELRRFDPAEEIALGTATDPYQPIERRARITRSLLEVFARKTGFRLGIVTKSTLITRDIDLLTEIAKNNSVVVHITITTPDTTLARLLEPRAPRPDLRFDAVRQLRAAGLRTGILCCPLLPGITDTQEALDTMALRAAQVDACFLAANPLFLKPCSRPTYLSFVQEHFPDLLPLYVKHFERSDFASRDYHRKIAAMLDSACRKHNLGQRRTTDVVSTRFDTPERKQPANTEAKQQRLFA